MAGHFQHLRLGFHGDDAQAQHVAEIAQPTPVDGTDAAGAAGNETADRRRAVGGGMQPQLLSRMGSGLVIDLRNDGTRLHHHNAGADGLHLVHFGQIEDDAAGQRHGLTVVAGPCAAHRHRHLMGVTGLQDLDHLRLGLRRYHQIAGHVIQLLLQHRRVPEEIAALLFHDLRIVLHGNPGKVRLQLLERTHSAAPRSSVTALVINGSSSR